MSSSRSLFKSTSIVSAMTMLSSILGFVRDIVTASLFGATASFDAFLIAFRIPNFMRDLFAEGAFSQAFVPTLASYQQQHSVKETLDFIARTLTRLASVLFVLTLVGEITIPVIVLLFAPGFLHDPERYHIAIHLLRITFPYLMLVSLTAFCSAVLYANGHFSAPAFTPVLLNILLILAAWFASSQFNIPEEAMAWGVFVAGWVQLFFLLPFLWRYKLFSRPQWHFKDVKVTKLVKNLIPALFGVSFIQISLLINTLFASFLKQGSITWLYYADRLTFFPLGVFGVSLATVVLSHLSHLHARHIEHDFKMALDWAFRLLLIISLPATVGMICMSGPLTITLFNYGAFDTQDVFMTQQVILAFSLGLPAFMAIKILTAGFYARHDLNKPVKITLIAIVLNIFLNSILISKFAHVGLALGTSVAAIFNASLLYLSLLRLGIYKPLPGWKKFLVQLLFANGVMCGALVWGVPRLNFWLNWNWHHRVLSLLLWLAIAILLYFGCLGLSGLRLKELISFQSNEVRSLDVAVK